MVSEAQPRHAPRLLTPSHCRRCVTDRRRYTHRTDQRLDGSRPCVTVELAEIQAGSTNYASDLMRYRRRRSSRDHRGVSALWTPLMKRETRRAQKRSQRRTTRARPMRLVLLPSWSRGLRAQIFGPFDVRLGTGRRRTNTTQRAQTRRSAPSAHPVCWPARTGCQCKASPAIRFLFPRARNPCRLIGHPRDSFPVHVRAVFDS